MGIEHILFGMPQLLWLTHFFLAKNILTSTDTWCEKDANSHMLMRKKRTEFGMKDGTFMSVRIFGEKPLLVTEIRADSASFDPIRWFYSTEDWNLASF